MVMRGWLDTSDVVTVTPDDAGFESDFGEFLPQQFRRVSEIARETDALRVVVGERCVAAVLAAVGV